MIDLTEHNPSSIWRRGEVPRQKWGTEPGWYRWYHTDSEERYLRCGNKEFSVEDVFYQFNNHGYRCKEFDEIDLNAFKIMMVGCSETFGMGIPQHLTYSEQLGRLIRQTHDIDVEVLNLGASGRSSDYIARLLFQSISILRPHYVFCLLPDMQRREYIIQNGHYLATVPFGTDPFTHEWYDEALLTLSTDPWDFFSMVKNLAMIELILRDTCWSWDTWMDENVWKMRGFESYFNLSHYRNQKCDHRGKARDNMHNGIQYHTNVANDLIGDPYLTRAIDLYRADLKR